MTEQEREREHIAVGRLRDLAGSLSGDVWQIEADDFGVQVIAKRKSGEEVPLVKFGKRASSDEVRLISNALPHLLMFLGLLDRAADRIRSLDTGSSKNFAAQASMLLSNGAFQRFLCERTGEPVNDKDSADRALKGELKISSKKQINAEPVAREAFLALRAEFEAWKGAPA